MLYISGSSRCYLLLFAVLYHETLVADVGEEETLFDDEVGGVLIGGVSGALVGVPLHTNMGITALLFVVSLLLLLLPLLSPPLSLSLEIGHFAIK
jgi:hypothetical protein